MSDRSAVVSGHTAIFFPDKKNSQLAGLRFFSTKVKKKKNSGIPDKSGGRPSLNKGPWTFMFMGGKRSFKIY